MSSYVELGILRVASVWLYNRPAAKSLTPFLEKVEDRVDYLAETLYCSLEEIMEPHWKNQREGSVYSYQEHKLRQEITSFLRCLPDQQLRNTVMIRLLLHSMEQLKYPIIPLGYTRLALDTIKSRSRSYFASSKQQQKEARMFTVKLRKILAGMDTYRAQSLFCLLQLLHYATSRSTSKQIDKFVAQIQYKFIGNDTVVQKSREKEIGYLVHLFLTIGEILIDQPLQTDFSYDQNELDSEDTESASSAILELPEDGNIPNNGPSHYLHFTLLCVAFLTMAIIKLRN